MQSEATPWVTGKVVFPERGQFTGILNAHFAGVIRLTTALHTKPSFFEHQRLHLKKAPSVEAQNSTEGTVNHN